MSQKEQKLVIISHTFKSDKWFTIEQIELERFEKEKQFKKRPSRYRYLRNGNQFNIKDFFLSQIWTCRIQQHMLHEKG